MKLNDTAEIKTYFFSKKIPKEKYKYVFSINNKGKLMKGVRGMATQHEYMAQRFRIPLRDALKEWDGSSNTDEFYDDLSWGAFCYRDL